MRSRSYGGLTMKSTQTQQIRAALESGESITPQDAWQKFGCMRLAARIKDLRDEGLPIETRTDTAHGHAVYSLAQGQLELGGLSW